MSDVQQDVEWRQRWYGRVCAWIAVLGLLAGSLAWSGVFADYHRAFFFPRRDLYWISGALAIAAPVLALLVVGLSTWRRKRAFTAVWLGALVWLAWLLAVDELWGRHGQRAVSRLMRELPTAQSIFREGDKENDGELDYGTIDELLEAKLLYEWSARPYGYDVAIRFGEGEAKPFLWICVASPKQFAPDTANWDDLAYVVNQSGVVQVALPPLTIAAVSSDCSNPKGSRPLADSEELFVEAGRPVWRNKWWSRGSPVSLPVFLGLVAVGAPLLAAWTLALGPFRVRVSSPPP